MTAPARLRQKQLGQFFSGHRLARLLAVLAGADQARSAVDPMAGRGDMLVAVRELAGEGIAIGGIELEPQAHAECAGRLPHATIVRGNAFDPAVLRQFDRDRWDLVQTNPPYVRYQVNARRAGRDRDPALPDAEGVRRGLLECLHALPGLTPTERHEFAALAQAYSGQSDLAVPSWILCAALTRPGGTLAMVVPATWLNREYAAPIRGMLRQGFRIRSTVEDADAAWFPDALVRTHLLVAERCAPSASYIQISVPRSASDDRSIVGAAFGGACDPDRAFACAIATGAPLPNGIVARPVDVDESAIPSAFRSLVGTPDLRTASDYGIRIGQGLRTGANRFFYARDAGTGDGGVRLALDPAWGLDSIEAPAEAVRPALRHQRELPSRPRLDPATMRARVLILTPDTRLTPGVQALIHRAETTRLGTDGTGVYVPTLSAVAPNERPRAGRRWYMLPALAPRHRPDLAIPRVCAGSPGAWLIPDRALVVDANFSTVWSDRPPAALLALFRSAWCQALMEGLGTVMGGGALKLEATHLRKLPLPALSDADWRTLSSCGVALGRGERDAAEAADDLVRRRLGLDGAMWGGMLERSRELAARRAR